MKKPTWILGLNPGFGGFNYHDPSAALVRDGQLVCAMEEERFNRIKNSPGLFPAEAVRHAMLQCGLEWSDLDSIAIAYSVKKWSERLPVELKIKQTPAELEELRHRAKRWKSEIIAASLIREKLPPEAANVPIKFLEHHKTHAASAYLPSGFDTCVALICDGVAEVDTLSVWLIDKGAFTLLHKIQFPDSIGYFYAAITSYLGFKPWRDEGVVMALAPYGRFDAGLDRQLRSSISLKEEGYDFSPLILQMLDNGFALDEQKAASVLAAIFGLPARTRADKLTSFHKNVAFLAQQILEDEICKTAAHWIKQTGTGKLVVAGGVFLNCKLNMHLRMHSGCEELYIQPVSGDGGVAAGAAWLQSMEQKENPRWPLRSLSLGYQAGTYEVQQSLDERAINYNHWTDLSFLATQLAAGKTVGFFYGRAEYGPRALGNRSILADPRSRELAEKINLKIKTRAPWRPFAPAILLEHAHEILEDLKPGQESPFMIDTFVVKPAWHDRLQGVLHEADNTTRVQTVDRTVYPEFAALIEAFYAITGVPALLNTSFNGKDAPIVNRPQEALDFFFETELDLLVLDNFIIDKIIDKTQNQPQWKAKNMLLEK